MTHPDKDPTRTLDEKFGFRAWEAPIQGQRTAHVHAEVEWNFLLEGSAKYFIAGRFASLNPGKLVMFWGAMPHRLVDYAPGSKMIWVTLPIAWLMEWNVGEELVKKMLAGELVGDPQTETGDADRVMLLRWVADLASKQWRSRMAAMLEAQARLYRLSEHLRGQPGQPAENPTAGNQVERITAYLGGHFLEDIAIADVAAAVGLHPNYAMSLFRQSCGMTLGDYITRLRIGHAQRLLLTTDQKVMAVAINSGFNSPSRFYEAFQQVSGKTPSEYRQALRGMA